MKQYLLHLLLPVAHEAPCFGFSVISFSLCAKLSEEFSERVNEFTNDRVFVNQKFCPRLVRF